MNHLGRLFLSVLATAALFYGLNFRHGTIPPLGPFLNPFSGFWQNNRSMDRLPETINIPELTDEVTVKWDDRRVPHIQATNQHDLYAAQGYVTARDRLWQMEFQAMASAGRLSEFIGSATIEYDKFRRRIGIVAAAEKAIEAAVADPESILSVEAFAKGVNAYIRTLSKKTLPLEYKVFDYEPEEWTPLKSSLLLKYFSFTLTFRGNDATMTKAREALGEKLMVELFPDYPPYMDPIIPAGTKWPFSVPQVKKPSVDLQSTNELYSGITEEDALFVGSNNLAVSGSRTSSGYPLLANDPHLSLTLPSIWHEIQLTSPEMNVYGVTSPGAPGVIIGFNENIAWGVTNGGTDVLDWYRIKWKDETMREYWHDGAWKPAFMRIEKIQVRGGETILDTVYSTHHGPVVYREHEKPFDNRAVSGTAMRWVALDSSNEALSFVKINKASTHDDFNEALKHFYCPAQNFVFADIRGNIAISHNGKFPVRWEGQGKYLADGSDSAYDWQGWVPHEHLPRVMNPPRGFVSSANQNPTDPSYPYYLGSDYAPHERGARINEKLATMTGVTAEEMMALQVDAVNIHARMLLLTLLSFLERSVEEIENEAQTALREWNYEYRSELVAPTIYESWWGEIHSSIWKDDLPRDSIALPWPSRDVTTWLLLNRPNNPYVDDKSTKAVETLRDIVVASFITTVKRLSEKHGKLGEAWRWGKARGTNLSHLGRIPGLGRYKLPTSGTHNAVNAITASGGPSWRMVVEVKPGKKAWGVYPGGQSGNPGSSFYDDMVDDWLNGRMKEILFLALDDSTHNRVIGKTVIRSKQ